MYELHCDVLHTRMSCCIEYSVYREKCADENIQCKSAHQDFRSVCLDVFVLKTVYYGYQERFGRMNEQHFE